MNSKPVQRTTERSLRRIFGLVPLLHRNPGIALDELVQLSGRANAKELREDLDRLMMFGVPPFSPADFITIFIDEQQRVFLDFPQGLEQPLDLTAREWIALQRLIREEVSFQDGTSASAEDLNEILKSMSSIPVEFDAGDPLQSRRALVQEALEDRLQLQFRYRSLSSRSSELRRVDPWALFQHRGQSYLLAHCHSRLSPRFFHLDRMDDLNLLDVEQEESPPESIQQHLDSSPIFQDQPRGYTVKLAFAPDLRAVLEALFQIFDVQRLEAGMGEREGWLRASCKVQESLWFRESLRGLGPGVQILSPDHLREAFYQDLMELEMPEPL